MFLLRKTEWLPQNKGREGETAVKEKTFCETEAWPMVSEEMDGFERLQMEEITI